METIYWIQRLGTIHTMAWLFFWITLIVAIIGFFIICAASDVFSNFDIEDEPKWKKRGLRAIKITMWTIVSSLLIGIFVPSENDIYVIYGIGGTIDYIKSNDTAKQLPDKVINALDAWIDNQIEDNNKDK